MRAFLLLAALASVAQAPSAALPEPTAEELARQALAAALEIEDPLARARWTGEAAALVSRSAPQAAREAVARVQRQALDGWFDEAAAKLAPPIAEADPRWAEELIAQIADLRLRQEARAVALGRMGDPSLARRWAAEVEEPGARALGLARAAHGAGPSAERAAQLALDACAELPEPEKRVTALLALPPGGFASEAVRARWAEALAASLAAVGDDGKRFELARAACADLADDAAPANAAAEELLARLAQSEDFALLAAAACCEAPQADERLLHRAVAATVNAGTAAVRTVAQALLARCAHAEEPLARRCATLLVGAVRRLGDPFARDELLACAVPVVARWDAQAATVLARRIERERMRSAALRDAVRTLAFSRLGEAHSLARAIALSPEREQALGIIAAASGQWQEVKQLSQPLRDEAFCAAALALAGNGRDPSAALAEIADEKTRGRAAARCAAALVRESPALAAQVVGLIADSRLRAETVAELVPAFAQEQRSLAATLALSIPPSERQARARALVCACRALMDLPPLEPWAHAPEGE